MNKTLIVLAALLFVILGSCTNEWEQVSPKESYTPEEIVELYNSYSAIYNSYGSLSSRGGSETVDPLELAKKLRPMSVEELEAYRDSLIAVHPEYPTKDIDPQYLLNQLLEYFTAEEVATFFNFIEEYPYVSDKMGYL